MLIFSSLCLLALWPVLGEMTFVIALTYILYSSARAATFLFISTEIEIDALNYDNILRSLFTIYVPRELEEQVVQAKRNRFRQWFAKSPAERHVLFQFVNQPPKVGRRVYFQFKNRSEK